MEDPASAGESGFALLGRRDGGYLEVLALDSGDGEALCLFETQKLADAFSRLSPEVRGLGWRVHVVTTDRLPELVEKFDYVTINPSLQPGARREIFTALGFARSLRRDSIPGWE